MAERSTGRPKKPVSKRRGPTLTSDRVEAIAVVIRGWEGRLTWRELCNAVHQTTGALYTRQALHNHLPIRAAYEAHASRPIREPVLARKGPDRAQVRLLQSEVAELKKIRDALLEKFSRWAYNAYLRGLDEDYLDSPLPDIDRAGNR